VTSLPSTVDVLVVGAGHAGLAMSHLLAEAGLEHVVVDRRDRPGGAWLDRWDGFRLVTPNWTSSFPGYAYDGPDPDGFMPRNEIAARVARYASVVSAPVALETEILRLTPRGAGGFRVLTTRGELRANRVVVATGSYHTPRIPAAGGGVASRVTQLHSQEYRNPGALPEGAVLVVGSGQSGVQIAEELAAAGRRVYLSAGAAVRMPRRYRGRDIFAWLVEILRDGPALGVSLPTVQQLPDPRMRLGAMPAVSGHGGGHETNLRRYAASGMQLAGRLVRAEGEHVTFAGDLAGTLVRADRFFDERFRPVIDGYVKRAGIDAPPAGDAVPFAFQPRERTELHLAREGISTIVWATGYTLDYGWIDAPILDEQGVPRTRRGVSDLPGLCFLGLLWQHSQASASLVAPTLDGPYLIEHLRKERVRAA
jgi:putative flavoprotein involved in K+ transport